MPQDLSKVIFDLIFTWKWTKRHLGDAKRPKKSRRRRVLDDFGPQVEIQRGPTSTLGATKIAKEAPKMEKLYRVAAS